MAIELMVEVASAAAAHKQKIRRTARATRGSLTPPSIIPLVAEDPRTTPMRRLRVRKGLDGPTPSSSEKNCRRSRRSQSVDHRGYDYAAPWSSCWVSSFVRSTSIVHSVTRAAIAPTAASGGARAAPTTPTVSGNSAIVRPSCLMITRRTFPSRMRLLNVSSSSVPLALIDSQYVCVLTVRPPTPVRIPPKRRRQHDS